MTITVVVRHPGAIEWMKKQGLAVDRWTDSLDLDAVEVGDTVIGVLPMYLAAQVCSKGATFVALTIDMPRESRGKEFDVGQLEAMSCRLVTFYVEERECRTVGSRPL